MIKETPLKCPKFHNFLKAFYPYWIKRIARVQKFWDTSHQWQTWSSRVQTTCPIWDIILSNMVATSHMWHWIASSYKGWNDNFLNILHTILDIENILLKLIFPVYFYFVNTDSTKV